MAMLLGSPRLWGRFDPDLADMAIRGRLKHEAKRSLFFFFSGQGLLTPEETSIAAEAAARKIDCILLMMGVITIAI